MEKQDLLSLNLPELEATMASWGQPTYRAKQIFDWLHQKRVQSFAEMRNLPRPLCIMLEDFYTIPAMTILQKQESALDGTVKYLFGLPDGNAIETVRMHYEHGESLCISTQVGCRMGCTFCASAIGGWVRNLTVGELLGQVYAVERESGRRIANIVLMGIGEPLDNFDNVIRFLDLVSDPAGKNLSLRSITVSTCGLADQILRLAELHYPITLAISLHAADDTARCRIMPVNRQWNLAELLDACKVYFAKTGRRLTFEYALIAGVNDSPADARKLVGLLQGIPAHINLIPVNPVVERGFEQSRRKDAIEFMQLLHRAGFAATLRRELGRDISAACGQLRHENRAKG